MLEEAQKSQVKEFTVTEENLQVTNIQNSRKAKCNKVLLVVMQERQPLLGKRLLTFLFLPLNLMKPFRGTDLLICIY